MRIIKINVCFYLLLILVSSCSENIKPHQLAGTYVYNIPNNIDTIKILENGNYIHISQSAKGETLNNKGIWEFDQKFNEIVFNDFIFYNEDGKGACGDWISRVKNIKNEIRLIYASEEGLFYKKIKK